MIKIRIIYQEKKKQVNKNKKKKKQFRHLYRHIYVFWLYNTIKKINKTSNNSS